MSKSLSYFDVDDTIRDIKDLTGVKFYLAEIVNMSATEYPDPLTARIKTDPPVEIDGKQYRYFQGEVVIKELRNGDLAAWLASGNTVGPVTIAEGDDAPWLRDA